MWLLLIRLLNRAPSWFAAVVTRWINVVSEHNTYLCVGIIAIRLAETSYAGFNSHNNIYPVKLCFKHESFETINHENKADVSTGNCNGILMGGIALESTYMRTDVENMKTIMTFLCGFLYTRKISKIMLIQSINHKTEWKCLSHTVIIRA